MATFRVHRFNGGRLRRDRLTSPRHSRSRSLGVQEKDVDTPEVKAALDFLEPYVRPQWLIPQYRDHVLDHARTNEVDLEGQQQVLRATFPASATEFENFSGVRADALARKFHEHTTWQ